ncbi:MAG TPA: radical SAM protein [Vicinamibacterales bacterium]|jgi:radical SAM protein with 4Fe4S-binding SPASM domain
MTTHLLDLVRERALAEGVPLAVHFDLTYRCNERCIHCYLDHDDHGEMTTDEVKGILEQLAAAGTLFLTFSGGELLLRRDFFELLEHARRLRFDVKIKTNAVLLKEPEAARIRALGVRQIQVSVYSHRPEVHDAITKVPGSLARTINAIRFLRAQGLNVIVANVLMRQNAGDQYGVRALAQELGAEYTLDPTITPKMDGDTSILALRLQGPQMLHLFKDRSMVGEDFCRPAPIGPVDDPETLDSIPCSAGHIACYITPYGDVYPCVQFPLPSGNLRRQRFDEIWRESPQLQDVRSIRIRDLNSCPSCSFVSNCTRCPGLAYMEGNMRGPSSADCEKSMLRASAAS